MNQVLEKLELIEKRLQTIENHLGIVQQDCSKMCQHISFIEHTYSLVRMPLSYLKNKVDYMMRVESPQPLPEIQK